jgi:uncharacterized protein
LPDVDRFFKIIERALFFHRANGVFDAALSRQQDDSSFGKLITQAREKSESIQSRHQDISDDRRRIESIGCLHGLKTVAGRLSFISPCGDNLAQPDAGGLFIVNYQYLGSVHKRRSVTAGKRLANIRYIIQFDLTVNEQGFAKPLFLDHTCFCRLTGEDQTGQIGHITEENMQAVSRDERTWAMLAHLSGLLGYSVLPAFGHILGPLIIWLVKKDQSWFIEDQAKEALNFQISMSIYAIISGVLVVVLIGFLLLGILYVLGIILIIIASLKANNGVQYRYPFTIRFIK